MSGLGSNFGVSATVGGPDGPFQTGVRYWGAVFALWVQSVFVKTETSKEELAAGVVSGWTLRLTQRQLALSPTTLADASTVPRVVRVSRSSRVPAGKNRAMVTRRVYLLHRSAEVVTESPRSRPPNVSASVIRNDLIDTKISFGAHALAGRSGNKGVSPQRAATTVKSFNPNCAATRSRNG